MHDPAGPALLVWLESTGLARVMREWLWLYPAVEIVHILGLVVLVGGIATLDLRLLGLSRALPLRPLARHVLPWSLGALLLIVPSGLLMFAAHATEFWSNPVFAVKMLLILGAGANALVFHRGAYRRWDPSKTEPPAAARAAGALSLATWASVIACGRLLAYV